jgi:catalase
MVPLRTVGRLVLDRNPDNFFAETEQVAFCTAHIIPGIDFSNDPLLQGRIHSYVDTQLTRLGGPNFHEIPINAPIAQVQNNQRDGLHRQAINRGRVNYEPNSLGGGCPFQAGARGFTSFPQPIAEDKVRGSPELFAEHYAQARLFFSSQTHVEQAHIANAFRFELTRVQIPAVRQRVLAQLANVDMTLAADVAEGLGMQVPDPLPLATSAPPPEYDPSPALSLLARPGETGIRTRKVAILVAHGVDEAMVQKLYDSLLADGAVPRLVGNTLGQVNGKGGAALDVEITLEAGPSVLYDAVVIPDGESAAEQLGRNAHAQDFVKEQYRHCKPIMAVGSGAVLLQKANVPPTLPDGSPDPALVGTDASDLDAAYSAFKQALSGHRAFERETDPPMV